MDANIQSIHRMLADKERKFLALAKCMMRVLNMAGGRAEELNISDETWDELAGELNEAFDYQLGDLE